MEFRDVQDRCYNQARNMGWWTDLQTDQPVDAVKVTPEKLMLIVTEVAEAMEGHRKGLKDDHIPAREMCEVELADAIIRILDLAGARGYDMEAAIDEKLTYNRNRADHQLAARRAEGGKIV